jgi:hypothetical protein
MDHQTFAISHAKYMYENKPKNWAIVTIPITSSTTIKVTS